MARVRYTGLQNPTAAFEALRPYNKALIEMATHYRPFGAEYLILDAARKALTTAAYHFTGHPEFYSLNRPAPKKP